jgi:hypothetical protein
MWEEFSLLHFVQTVYVAYPAFCPIDVAKYSLGVKRQELEADHSPPTNAKVKKARIYSSTPPYGFLV